jgi:hypothetical protein
LTQTLPLALAAAISELEGLPVVLGAAMLPEAAGVALELAGAAGFVAELAPLELACALTRAGEMANVTIRQKASSHRASLL